MKIIDALWEKRNLGIETKEIVVEEDDTCEAVCDDLRQITAEYVVVKVPAMRVDVNTLLAELGYVYAETMIDIYQDVMHLPEMNVGQELVEQMRIIPMDDHAFERMIRLVRKGIFHTDRIALDPYFTVGIANRRYAFWMQDARARGVKFFEVLKGETPIGFYGADQEHYIFLSGLYPKFQGQGLGNCLTRKMSLHYREQGIPGFKGKVSSNNIASLKRCLKNGYQVQKMTYIFTEHNLKREDYFERLRVQGIIQENGEVIIDDE